MDVVEELTPVETLTDDNDDEVMSVVVDNEDKDKSEDETDCNKDESDTNRQTETEPDDDVETLDEEVAGAVGGRVEVEEDVKDDSNETAEDAKDSKLSSDTKPIGAKRNFDHLSDNVSE